MSAEFGYLHEPTYVIRSFEFALGLKPIVQIITGLLAALKIDFMGTYRFSGVV